MVCGMAGWTDCHQIAQRVIFAIVINVMDFGRYSLAEAHLAVTTSVILTMQYGQSERWA
jgi:hypothetical protein